MLVLLPGMEGTGELFQVFVEVLKGRLQPLCVSYPRDGRLTYQQLEEQVLDSLPGRHTPYVLLAESFSGPVAVRIGARKPDGLRGIVLVTSFVESPVPGWLYHVPWASVFRLGIPRLALRFLMAGPNCSSRLALLSAAITSVAPAVMAQRLRDLLLVDARDALLTCDMPILYVAGAKDRLLGRRGLDQVLKAKPDALSVVIDGPHLLMLCNPREVLDAILPFLDSCLSH